MAVKVIKPGRSLSGVTPLSVMMKAFNCPGQCVYCPSEVNMPKSYLSDEPAAQRARNLNFDPYRQVEMRLTQLKQNGHPTDKLEVIVTGGTFSAYPDDYKVEFVKRIYDAANENESSTLEEAQKGNETAKQRVVALSVETRPDFVTEEEVRLIRRLGVTKIQLGVQAVDEEIARLTKRGHGATEVANATRILRNAGLKICYHLMPNLPGSNPEKDIEMSRLIYSDPRFMPDYVKIYPCMVIKGTELYRMWQKGEYKTYDDKTLKEVLKEICVITPQWVRIDRLVRDISRSWVGAGTIRTNMRQEVERELINEGRACKCIRCREIKDTVYSVMPILKRLELDTLGGREVFFSYENEHKLYALLRLRLPEEKMRQIFDELKGAAIVREVHSYGQVMPLSTRSKGKAQHQGLGRLLMRKAEEEAVRNGYKKIAVISAIGTHEYYRKLGYSLTGLYMVKNLVGFDS